jgi:hypothetical protein
MVMPTSPTGEMLIENAPKRKRRPPRTMSCQVKAGRAGACGLSLGMVNDWRLEWHNSTNHGSHDLRELIHEAQRRSDHQELGARLRAGLQSPTGEMTAEEWAALRERIVARDPELRD